MFFRFHLRFPLPSFPLPVPCANCNLEVSSADIFLWHITALTFIKQFKLSWTLSETLHYTDRIMSRPNIKSTSMSAKNSIDNIILAHLEFCWLAKIGIVSSFAVSSRYDMSVCSHWQLGAMFGRTTIFAFFLIETQTGNIITDPRNRDLLLMEIESATKEFVSSHHRLDFISFVVVVDVLVFGCTQYIPFPSITATNPTTVCLLLISLQFGTVPLQMSFNTPNSTTNWLLFRFFNSCKICKTFPLWDRYNNLSRSYIYCSSVLTKLYKCDNLNSAWYTCCRGLSPSRMSSRSTKLGLNCCWASMTRGPFCRQDYLVTDMFLALKTFM